MKTIESRDTASPVLSGAKIQRKWKSLRNCFTRELTKQKSEKSGAGSSNRKKYMYFDILTFLIPALTDKRYRLPRGHLEPFGLHGSGIRDASVSFKKPAVGVVHLPNQSSVNEDCRTCIESLFNKKASARYYPRKQFSSTIQLLVLLPCDVRTENVETCRTRCLTDGQSSRK